VSIAEIKKLPLADEIQIMEALWEDLCSQPDQVEIPEWHRHLFRSAPEGI